ncbi:hypothetical protein [Spongorhabdus nitratireducens]
MSPSKTPHRPKQYLCALDAIIIFSFNLLSTYWLGQAGDALNKIQKKAFGVQEPKKLGHGLVRYCLLVLGSKAYIEPNQAVGHNIFVNLPLVGAQAFIIFMSILAEMILANIISSSRKTL